LGSTSLPKHPGCLRFILAKSGSFFPFDFLGFPPSDFLFLILLPIVASGTFPNLGTPCPQIFFLFRFPSFLNITLFLLPHSSKRPGPSRPPLTLFFFCPLFLASGSLFFFASYTPLPRGPQFVFRYVSCCKIFFSPFSPFGFFFGFSLVAGRVNV